jgi:hypothetical protein
VNPTKGLGGLELPQILVSPSNGMLAMDCHWTRTARIVPCQHWRPPFLTALGDLATGRAQYSIDQQPASSPIAYEYTVCSDVSPIQDLRSFAENFESANSLGQIWRAKPQFGVALLQVLRPKTWFEASRSLQAAERAAKKESRCAATASVTGPAFPDFGTIARKRD